MQVEVVRVEGHKRGVPFCCRIRLDNGKVRTLKHPDGMLRMFPNVAMAIKAGNAAIDRILKP